MSAINKRAVCAGISGIADIKASETLVNEALAALFIVACEMKSSHKKTAYC